MQYISSAVSIGSFLNTSFHLFSSFILTLLQGKIPRHLKITPPISP